MRGQERAGSETSFPPLPDRASSGDQDVASLLDGLNRSQKQAVTFKFDRHCLVLAGAGCGKTAVLTRRIAFCATSFCRQNRILALTFTRKAAQEMASRLLKLPGIIPSEQPPAVTTFHGFGLSVHREEIGGVKNYRRLGFSAEPHILTDENRIRILSEISTRKERLALKRDLFAISDLVECAAVAPHKLARLPAESAGILNDLKGRYAQKKAELNVWEFSDMINGAIGLLSGFPEVIEHYKKRFDYLLVDEFQDTNPLQITFLKKMLEGGAPLFAVGDDDQAIYGFRGADVEPMMKFVEIFPGADTVKLEMNYRSRPAILKSANRIFRDKPAEYRKILVSGKYESSGPEFGSRPEKRTFNDQAAMVSWIKSKLTKIQSEKGIPVSEMALLFRLNETAERVRTALENESVMPAPRIMTVHGSKGLEFSVVFLCDLEEGVFPHYRIRKRQKVRSWGDLFARCLSFRKHGKVDCDLDEERRLFYVGVTRAEQRLFLISVKKKIVDDRMRVMSLSRFVGYI